MKALLRIALFVLLWTYANASVRAADAPAAEAARIERLAHLAQVWGTVRYLHPYLAYKEIDWDAALVAAVPKVSAAADTEAYAAAVQEMLDALGDPATRVHREATSQPAATDAAAPAEGKADGRERPLFTWIEDGVLAVHIGNAPSPNSLIRGDAVAALSKEIARARGLIFDLRGVGWAHYAFDRIAPLLPSRELSAPARRYLVHSGYRPQEGWTSGGYSSAFQTELMEGLRPAADARPRRIVFLADDRSSLPLVALALQQGGEGFLVAQGGLTDLAVVHEQDIRLAPGIVAQIRTAELVGPSGLLSVRPDVEVPAGADAGPQGPAFKAAVALIRGDVGTRKPAEAAASARLPQAIWRPDRRYEEMKYPSAEYRLLALFRFWNIIHYFYPYKHLIGDWDAVLPEFIPRFEAARDAREYELAIAGLATHVPDGHTTVFGPELNRYLGETRPPVALRVIEGAPVVTALLDEAIARDAGIQVGDVVLAVDGEPVEQRIERYGKYIAASTPAAHRARIATRLLGGPDGSTAQLTIRDGENRVKKIRLPRRAEFGARRVLRGGEVYRALPGSVGYVDLERLTVAQVDAMFEALRETRAIIFDLRGYPQGTAWPLAPRLNVRGARYAAAFERCLVSTAEPGTRFKFLQPIGPTENWKYTGKTVTLIDERAISQSEHTGLFLEAACGTTFIGSHTQGANGDVTYFFLPGGIRVMFTGHDVRHADGRQLQRIGLVPHIEVHPTIAGIRAGKDEVLERALQYLREPKTP